MCPYVRRSAISLFSVFPAASLRTVYMHGRVRTASRTTFEASSVSLSPRVWFGLGDFLAMSQPPPPPPSSEESLVALRVMRLCRPSFVQQPPLPGAAVSAAASSSGAGGVGDGALLTGWMALPQSFGDIYLGETFSCYISLANVAGFELGAVALKVEVQTQLRDVGIHILICSASYSDREGTRRSFRKFFKFAVQNPLSMKSKTHSLSHSDEILVETQLQNATPHLLFLESYLRPGDTQQYMYRLTPRTRPSAGGKPASGLGRMEVIWKGAMGEAGHLQSNLVHRKSAPSRPLDVAVVSAPEAVELEAPFELRCVVTNASSKPRELTARLEAALDRPIVATGALPRSLGLLKPQTSLPFTLSLLPLEPGVHAVSGLQLVDVQTGEAFDVGPLAPLLVLGPGEAP
ncbi:hypothetical protein EMIHUDRAFT_237225 [Emiliania huxleyi CCMP1516]|uniref:Trafficking protein particle complex subunit 13 n=2 Tax=Emiliania huxleyi TaxID=2903 RepID=A0A0D3JRD2_EMIH1|nr:hypothetical protein EMIHUDRAFT_237225 [Emiliania huxleyi CCMP1516]EOD26067.1 hypothetical protein EMIHUDRAFT_237225 [Emiliania huxleyi CCMP1516]|eukprot:XP_005778496.1 hypothetical protein EMIHUDRAFT_237225 [Emiliania huxleyi CCMP1516]